MKTFTFEKILDNQEVIYVVTLDEEKMTELRKRVKEKESHAVHYDYKSLTGPFDRKKPGEGLDDETITISNYKREVTMVEDPSNPKVLLPMYRFEYDLNFFPHLCVLIDNALQGNLVAFQEIMNPTFEKEYIPIRSLISDREEQYMGLKQATGGEALEKKLQILDELKELLLKVKEKDYDIPIKKYYEEAQQLFTIHQGVMHENDDEETTNLKK